MLKNLKTDKTLLKKLKDVAGRELSVNELRQQRISFIYGNMSDKSSYTRAQVAIALAHIDGTERKK